MAVLLRHEQLTVAPTCKVYGSAADRRGAHVLFDSRGFPNVSVSAACTTNRSMVACSSAVRCT